MDLRPQDLQTIADFARHLGIAARPAADGSCSFVFDRSGTLTFTPGSRRDRIVLSLSRDLDRADDAVLGRALEASGYDPTHGCLLHAGLSGDRTLILSLSLDVRGFTLPALETGLQRLMALHESVG